jgi:hypothetical protein
MVRLPPGFHPQAVRNGNKLANRPGLNGTGMQRMQPVPIGAYQGKFLGVPLSGGQVQGVIPAATASGSATSPSTFQILATVSIPAGTSSVNWSVTLAGTVGAGDANNFAVRIQSGAMLAQSVNAGAAGTYPQAPIAVTGPVVLQLETWSSAPTAGSIYSGSITAANSGLTLTVGPQGIGTVWYPAQATISTTTGPLDTSTCKIYLGTQGVPIALVATLFPGGAGTAALAIPPMTPGQVLIFQWTGGHVGDIAAANIVGTQDALTTSRLY